MELLDNEGNFSDSDQVVGECESDEQLTGNYKTHVKKNGTVVFTKNSVDTRPKRDRKRPMLPPIEYKVEENEVMDAVSERSQNLQEDDEFTITLKL